MAVETTVASTSGRIKACWSLASNMNLPADFDHPSWLTALGTFAGYGVILLAMFLVLFLVPYAIFVALG